VCERYPWGGSALVGFLEDDGLRKPDAVVFRGSSFLSRRRPPLRTTPRTTDVAPLEAASFRGRIFGRHAIAFGFERSSPCSVVISVGAFRALQPVLRSFDIASCRRRLVLVR